MTTSGMPLTSSTRSARFSLAPARNGELRRDDVLVPLEVAEVNQTDGDVLAVLAERHRALAREPGRELLVGLHEPVGPDTHHYRPQPIQHVVGPVGLRGDLRIQPNQCLAQVVLDQHLLWLACGGPGARGNASQDRRASRAAARPGPTAV